MNDQQWAAVNGIAWNDPTMGSRADAMPGEIVDAVALALYECEKRRADNMDRVIAAARGVPTVRPTMDPWEECAEIFLGDARVAINTYLDAAYPIEVGERARWIQSGGV